MDAAIGNAALVEQGINLLLTLGLGATPQAVAGSTSSLKIAAFALRTFQLGGRATAPSMSFP